jgi:hypothetical protein
MSGRRSRFHQSKAPYTFASRKDKQFVFSRPEKSKYRVFEVPAEGRSASWISEEERAIEAEIEAAKFMLSIKGDLESDAFVPYTAETLSRVTGFLRRLMIYAEGCNLGGFPTPQIGPADQGSIDLYWEAHDRSLLINFSALHNSASFYGKKPKSEISGKFEPSEARPELAFWLVDYEEKLVSRRNS